MAVPMLALAAEVGLDSSVINLVQRFVDVIIDPLILLLFAVALLLFFWGLFQLILDLSNGGKGEEGKKHMLWGIVGMIVMFSVGGIINLIANSIGADDATVNVERF